MKNEREPFLQVEDLVVEYTSDGDTVHAINGVTFSLEKGKTLALVGETGAGKTTIAKSILRILPDRAARIVSGNVAVDGQNLLRISEKEMREVRGRKISMVFQDPMTALNPTMRVGEQIAEVIRIHNRVSKTEAAKMATEMLQMVGITPERYGEYPHQFSGGMKQRVIIAMALACTPELLLADEPTTALDVTIQAQSLEMIAELRKKYNTSMLLITHDLGIVAANADEVAVIYAGQILEYGSVDVVFNNPSNPYTIGLFGAIPDLEADTRRLANIDGLPPDPTNLPEGCCFSPRCPYACDACYHNRYELEEIEQGHLCRCGNLQAVTKEEYHG